MSKNRIEGFFKKPDRPPIPVIPPAPPVTQVTSQVNPVISNSPPALPKKAVLLARLRALLILSVRGYAFGFAIAYLMLCNEFSRDEAFRTAVVTAWAYTLIGMIDYRVRESFGGWRSIWHLLRNRLSSRRRDIIEPWF